jgi:hypothetical protein
MFPALHGILEQGASVVPTPTSSPYNLYGAGLSTNQIYLNWVYGGASADQFDLQYDTSSSFPSPTTVSLPNSPYTYTLGSLSAGTFYYFRIRSKDLSGTSGWSDWTSAETLAATQNIDDLSSTPLYVFGFERLISTYTGNCVRLRRVSDDAIEDYDFDSNGYLDIEAIIAWIGDSTARVVIWYDQSGNGNNAVQNTNDNQMVLEFPDGVPALTGNGSTHLFCNLPTAPIDPQSFTICIANKNRSSSGLRFALAGHIGTGVTSRVYMGNSGTGIYARAGGNSGDSGDIEGGTVALGTTFVHTMTGGSGTLSSYINLGSASTGSFTNSAAELEWLTIGRYTSGTTTGNLYNGHIYEVVILDGVASTADREALVAGQLSRASAGTNPNNATASHAASPQTTPTYDGSDQATHPDVLYVLGGWNGYTHWMAMTPYPNSDNTKENPSILASNNGESWEVPSGLTNPLDPAPGGSEFNTNTDLIIDQSGVMWCLWRRQDNTPNDDIIYARSSTDGINWSTAEVILTGGHRTLVSPSIIWDGLQYVLFYVDVNPTQAIVYRRTATAVNGTWSTPYRVWLGTTRDTIDVWRLNITRDRSKNEYHMIINRSSSFTIRFATSKRGSVWRIAGPDMLTPTSGWTSGWVYRSSAVWVGDTYYLWYSARTSGSTHEWRIGRTSISL